MKLPWFQAISRREHPPEVARTPGEANVRVPIIKSDHPAPDAPRQGFVRARPSMVNVVTFFHDQTLTQEDRFVATIVGPSPHAQIPRGGMTPDAARANLRVPPHVAYGSLFVGN